MTDYTLDDISGIQPGDTIVCTQKTPTIKFGPGPATVQSLTLDLNAGDTVADLPSQPADDSNLLVKVGTGSGREKKRLRYDADDDAWYDEPLAITSQGDSWAMDMGGYPKADRTGWQRLLHPVPYGVPFALLNGSHDFSASNFDSGTHTGVVTVDDTTDSGHHSEPFAETSAGGGYGRVAGILFSYLAKTGTTFTGCAVVAGTRATVDSGEYVSQGRDGGYGFNNLPLSNVGAMFEAGFIIQEQIVALMNSAAGGKKLSVGVYWNQYDAGDGIIPPTVPMSGGMGVGNVVISDETRYSQTVPAQVHAERPFYMMETLDSGAPEWLDWKLAAPTKKFLVATIVGSHEAGVDHSGSTLDTKVQVRYKAIGT